MAPATVGTYQYDLACGSATASVTLAVNAQYPLGIFAASGVTLSSDNPLTDPNALGGLIRVSWNQLETAPGNFNFALVNSQVDTVECNAYCYGGQNSDGGCRTNLSANGRSICSPKDWSLAVLGGLEVASPTPGSPTWLSDGALSPAPNVATFSVYSGNMPEFWDATLQGRIQLLANALARQYGADPYLKLVYVPQMTKNGVEGQFNGIPPSTLEGVAGFTTDSWVASVESAAVSYARAFPTKSIAIELHYLLGSSCEGLRVMHDIETNSNGFATLTVPAYLQIGTAIWWFDGDTNYQADLITGPSAGADTQDAYNPSNATDPYGVNCYGYGAQVESNGFQGFIASGGRVYAQNVSDLATSTTEFPLGFGAPFGTLGQYGQAEGIGIRYIEVWQQNIGSTSQYGDPTYETYYSGFDAYAIP